MGSLFASLHNVAGTMQTVQKGIRIIQNNVANISTPGYARQRQLLAARNFDADSGLAGGVVNLGVADSRSEFAERTVRLQLEYKGSADKQVDRLEQIEQILGIGADEGVPGSMNRLFKAFSVLTVSPNDTAARQVALDRASELAKAFRTTSDRLSENQNATAADITTTVNRINELGQQLAGLNRTIRTDIKYKSDSGIQAQMHNTLEELAELTNATVLFQEDGSASIYVGGQSLFVIGENHHPLGISQVGSALHITGVDGVDITSTVSRGQLGGLLQLNNQLIPSYAADLDVLASGLADTTNGILRNGIDSTGNNPAVDLFAYDPLLGSARTMQANALAPGDLAMASMGAPGGNGNALELATLSSQKPAPLGGFTFATYYGNLAARAGRDLSTTQESADTQTQLVLQAQDLRDQLSKVDLDEEAVMLLELQRSYQANAEMVRTLNEMTETTLSLLR